MNKKKKNGLVSIASWDDIRSKTGHGNSGNSCPSKSEILSNSSNFQISGSYQNNELVGIDDISHIEYGWNYYFNITSSNPCYFPPDPSCTTVTANSYKIQTMNGTETGVREEVGWEIVEGSPSYFTVNGHQICSVQPSEIQPTIVSYTVRQYESGIREELKLHQYGRNRVTFTCTGTSPFQGGFVMLIKSDQVVDTKVKFTTWNSYTNSTITFDDKGPGSGGDYDYNLFFSVGGPVTDVVARITKIEPQYYGDQYYDFVNLM